MNNKTASAMLLTLLLTSLLTFAFNINRAEATVIVYIRPDGSVDPPTAPIQRMGDTYEFTGVIYGSVVVQRSNIIIDGKMGFEWWSPKLQGTGNGCGLDLSNVSNVTVKRTRIMDYEYGIYLQNASGCSLRAKITDANSSGIYARFSNWNSIESSIEDSWRGITLIWSNYNSLHYNSISCNGGIELWFSIGNTINKNYIDWSPTSAISLHQSTHNNLTNNYLSENAYAVSLTEYSSNNTLEHNEMTYGSNGIYLNCSNNNMIADNEILHNTGFGIHPQLSSGNVIQHNNFIGNGKSVETHQIRDNIWDNDYPSGGNYWSDHESTDFYSGPHQDQIGNDGIGDIPYILNAGNRDHYPFYVPLRFVFLSVEPRYVVDIPINGSFNIDLTVFNVENLHGWQFELHYDPTLLSAIDVIEGSFLSDIAETVFLRQIHNSEGYMLIAATFYPLYPVVGAEGIGTLATVTFKVKSEGQSKLELNENKTKLREVLGGINVPIDYLKRDGYFTNQAICCSMDIEPGTLNLKSNGKWITVFIQLPAEYEPKYIDVSSLSLNGVIQPVSDQEQGFATDPNDYLVDHDGDGILELMIKFDRAAVKSFILSQDPARVITLVFTGKLLYGVPIRGEDTLFIIPATRRKL